MAHQVSDQTAQAKPGRIGLLDTLRGVALLAMAHYHFTWDLEMFGYLDPGTATTGWFKIYARAIASTFLFLAGFSLFLAHKNSIRWEGFGKRLGMIAAAAFAITVATLFAVPNAPIFFGILHNIAASSLLGLLFLRMPPLITLAVAIAFLVAPHYLTSDVFSAPAFYWLGLAPIPPISNDYVPIIPWFGAFLLGMAASQWVVPRGWLDRLRKPSHPKNLIALAGRRSLTFYLVHQPILIGLVYLASMVAPPAPIDQVESYKRSCEASCTHQGNDAGICGRFCGCTLELLQAKNLFDPMIAQTLNVDQQNQIQDVAQECRALAN